MDKEKTGKLLRILLVEDNEHDARAFRRAFEKAGIPCKITHCVKAEEAMERLDTQASSFDLVVSDNGLPGTSGMDLFKKLHTTGLDLPFTIITGAGTEHLAVEALKAGVDEYIIKDQDQSYLQLLPIVLPEVLRRYDDHRRLIIAEQELLRNTLTGGVKILNDVLNLVNPVAYEIACRIRNYVRHITTQLKLSNSGQFEIAAMLSQIGCIIVPQSILHKVYTGQSLSDAEYEKFFSHPSTAYRLLISIPRLESVASMVQGQQRSLNSYAPAKDLTQQNSVALGSQMLKVTSEFDKLIVRGLSREDALSALRAQPAEYNPQMVAALTNLES